MARSYKLLGRTQEQTEHMIKAEQYAKAVPHEQDQKYLIDDLMELRE
ncbi:hypothetical protein [Paenibacillus sp. 1001270B_150601_E10]|nr:hypothetical protein [Paenibacillus sp. 1001270B_150601_E10]